MCVQLFGADMMLMRVSLLAFLTIFAATGAPAAPVVAEDTIGPTQVAEPAVRKGTRKYRADETPAATAPADSTTTAKSRGPSRADKLSQCMDTWDTGTHITKSKWREICQRQLNER